MMNESGSGKNRERKLNSRDGWIASPAMLGGSDGDVVERARPASVTGIAIAKPTSGPETPMSRRARRFGIGSRMLMNAPSVPSGGNEGRKNGSEAWTLYLLATRKWPISWEPRIVRSGREKNRLP